jgi:hypothetical protein
MSKYEFDQLCAEAIVRIGRDPVFRYLEAAARRVGWPIPQQHREQVVFTMVLLVWATEHQKGGWDQLHV